MNDSSLLITCVFAVETESARSTGKSLLQSSSLHDDLASVTMESLCLGDARFLFDCFDVETRHFHDVGGLSFA